MPERHDLGAVIAGGSDTRGVAVPFLRRRPSLSLRCRVSRRPEALRSARVVVADGAGLEPVVVAVRGPGLTSLRTTSRRGSFFELPIDCGRTRLLRRWRLLVRGTRRREEQYAADDENRGQKQPPHRCSLPEGEPPRATLGGTRGYARSRAFSRAMILRALQTGGSSVSGSSRTLPPTSPRRKRQTGSGTLYVL